MDELGRLPAPREVEPSVKSMIEDVNESWVVLEAVFEAENREEASGLVTRITELAASSRRAADEAGLQSCLPEQTP